MRAQLRQLLPEDIAVVASMDCPGDTELLGLEQAATSGMVTRRLNEFRHGRHCAREAMRTLQLSPVAIPRGADRAPQWPSGLVGSITHTGQLAAAAVGLEASYIGIGLDVETSGPLSADVLALVLRPDEQEHVNALEGRLFFSAKEAVYKCVYPTIRAFIDFKEMHISLDHRRHQFAATPKTANWPQTLPPLLKGKFMTNRDFIACAVCIPQCSSVSLPTATEARIK